MFPLPALITREPRPAERSVARRPGIVFTRHAAVVHEPKRRGLERASAAQSAMKFAENRVFRRCKAVKVV